MFNNLLPNIFKFSIYYLISLIILGLIVFIEFVEFNENFLIGSLFTIGFITVVHI